MCFRLRKEGKTEKMNREFIKALDALQQEKKIDKMSLISAIEESIATAYKKHYGNAQDVEVDLDDVTGEIRLFVKWQVVEEVENPDNEITLEAAREKDQELNIGDIYLTQVHPRDFGRIAAQNAKQLIFQKIKEAERNALMASLQEKQNEVVSGIITRVDRNMVFVDIGDFEAALLPSEQINGEVYEQNQRLKVMILSVRSGKNGPQVTVSRTHPMLVKRLFEAEVPEIYDGHVEITAISREAGSRTKIAVKANSPELDPVGSCVGHKGVRVQQVINDLGGEKIDIIKYSDDIRTFITNALSPAKVIEILPRKDEKMAIAVVDDHQFSLAIGKEGQNVRLAAKLTGWKIDIKNKESFETMKAETPELLAGYGDFPSIESTKSLDELLTLDDTEDTISEMPSAEEEDTTELQEEGQDDISAEAEFTEVPVDTSVEI